jgi:hypothetical protein
VLKGGRGSVKRQRREEKRKMANSVVEPETRLRQEGVRQAVERVVEEMEWTHGAYEDCPVVGEGR